MLEKSLIVPNAKVQEILAQINWEHDVEVSPLNGGLTNHTFHLRKADASYTLRLFGKASDHFVDRHAELHCHKVFGKIGLAPELVVISGDHSYLITEFVEGQLVTHSDYCEPAVFAAIAKSMRKLHQSKCSITRVFHPMEAARKLLQVVFNSTQLPVARQRIDKLFRRISHSLEGLPHHTYEYVPCHLDLVPANVILRQNQGKDPAALFIDWEYAAMAPLELEFANIFAELEIDGKKEMELLRLYFAKEDVSEFYHRVTVYRCFTAFYWFLWCVIQAEHSSLERDYKSFGAKYLKQAEELVVLH